MSESEIDRARDAILAHIGAGQTARADEVYRLRLSPPCERHHLVAAAWDLVEDDVLTYDASATFTRVT